MVLALQCSSTHLKIKKKGKKNLWLLVTDGVPGVRTLHQFCRHGNSQLEEYPDAVLQITTSLWVFYTSRLSTNSYVPTAALLLSTTCKNQPCAFVAIKLIRAVLAACWGQNPSVLMKCITALLAYGDKKGTEEPNGRKEGMKWHTDAWCQWKNCHPVLLHRTVKLSVKLTEPGKVKKVK